MEKQIQSTLLSNLKERFVSNMHRHPNTKWAAVEEALLASSGALESLFKMEETGGEPDVVEFQPNLLTFADCAKETPLGRRSLCYDNEALNSRKQNKPAGSALEMANAMGKTLLSEEQYKLLQTLEPFDTKTSSWILTPQSIRLQGGALFCDRRYNHVFTYHNGADSYYSSRAFRTVLCVK